VVRAGLCSLTAWKLRQHTFDGIIKSVAWKGPKPETVLGIVSEMEYGARHVVAWMADKRVSLIVRLSLIVPLWVFPFSLRAQETHVAPPNLKSILDSLERTGAQNPALSQPHELTREYKVFHGDDPKPMSDVTTQITFTPPDVKTFKITDAQGSATGKKIVSAILEQEVASATDGHQRDISRANYNFSFLREQDFGVVPEYVLHIIPKRKEKGLLLGDIWVDAKTYRIRQIIGVPLKTPSFWVKDLHITVQFAEMNQMWLPVSVDAIATVRFLGIYTLSGLDLAPPISASNTPNY
jgi:hypothetical protein